MAATPIRDGRGITRALSLAFVLVMAGCSLTRGEARDPFAATGPRGASKIRIEVLNLNYNDATLHARRGGERHRLGIVTGKSAASYVLDWPLSVPLQIEIDLLAGESCITRPLNVDPGDIVELQIEVALRSDLDCSPLRGR